jgi:phage-related protein
MASRIAEAYVQIVPRIDGVAAGISGQLSTQMATAGTVSGASFSTGFKNIVGPALIAATAIAAAAIGKLLTSSVTAASDFAEAGAAVNEVFGGASKTIQDFADSASTSLGQSSTQVLNASKQFGIYGKAAGLAGEENAAFSMDLVRLATDLASFNNTSVDDAILALGSGLRGEAEPLRRYGVLLDDAALKAQAMEMGIYDGNGALTQQQKVLAANSAIFAQTITQQGDFERTSDGLANQQRILAAQFSNIQKLLGDFLLPTFTSIAQVLTKSVMPAFSAFLISVRDNGLAQALQETFAKISSMRQDFMDATLKALPGIIDAIVGFIPVLVQNWGIMVISLINALTAALPQLIAGAVQFFTALVNALIIVIPIVITAITEAIPTIIDALVKTLPSLIEGAIKLFTGLIEGLLKILPVLIQAVVELIPVIVNALISVLPELVKGAIQLFLGIVQGLIEALPEIITAVVEAVPLLIDALVEQIPLLVDGAMDLFLGIIDGLILALPDIISAIIDNMPKIIGAIIGAIPQFVSAGFQLIGGLISGILGAFPKLVSTIVEGIGKAIDAGKKALGIKSPSRVFMEIGSNVMSGMTLGIEKNSKNPVSAITDMTKKLTRAGSGSASYGMLPSLVSPQSSFGDSSTSNTGQTINYYAAPNQSLDAEQALLQAVKRARVITGW